MVRCSSTLLHTILLRSMVTVEPLTHDSFADFVQLVTALAEYENLAPPNEQAVERLRRDAFAVIPRFWAWIAYNNKVPSGYAIAFETYSSFLAKPTMFLEDLFVLEKHRGAGIGSALFETVKSLATERECGRMEWMVLDWNEIALDFYAYKDATLKDEWVLCRIEM